MRSVTVPALNIFCREARGDIDARGKIRISAVSFCMSVLLYSNRTFMSDPKQLEYLVLRLYSSILSPFHLTYPGTLLITVVANHSVIQDR